MQLQPADFLAHSIATLNFRWLERLIGPGQVQALWANLGEKEFKFLSEGTTDILKEWRRRKQREKPARRKSRSDGREARLARGEGLDPTGDPAE